MEQAARSRRELRDTTAIFVVLDKRDLQFIGIVRGLEAANALVIAARLSGKYDTPSVFRPRWHHYRQNIFGNPAKGPPWKAEGIVGEFTKIKDNPTIKPCYVKEVIQ